MCVLHAPFTLAVGGHQAPFSVKKPYTIRGPSKISTAKKKRNENVIHSLMAVDEHLQ